MKRRLNWRAVIGRSDPFAVGVVALLGVVLVGSMSASAWWTLRVQANAARDTRVTQLRDLTEVLAGASQALLAGNELSALRRQIVETAAIHDLETCRVVLGDGRVVASSDVNDIDAVELPDTWGGATAQSESIGDHGSVDLTAPIDVIGRGPASVQISAGPVTAAGSVWETRLGIGAIGVAGLAVLLVIQRLMDRRFRAASGISSAIRAFQAKEPDPNALRISEEFGPDASGWNDVITKLEELDRQLATERSRHALTGPRRADNDLSPACDAMWNGVVVVDDRERISYINGAAAVLLGIDREEATGSDASGYLTDEGVMDRIRDALGNAKGRVTLEHTRDEGERCVIRYGVRPFSRDEKPGVLIVVDDVTQQRQADESRNAFVATATHELRTPLTNIKLYVEEAVDAPPGDVATRANALNVINQEARRLERLVGDMLSVSEIEAGSLRVREGDLRLDALFTELRHDYAAQSAEKEIDLIFDLPPKLPVTIADRDKIALALHNLIGNALKYTPAGGEVVVRVIEQNGTMIVSVIDNGIGISPEDCERVFEKFYRAKDKRITHITGSGIGLALAREVVRLHGGEITVESERDKGSTFTLTLPLRTRAAAA